PLIRVTPGWVLIDNCGQVSSSGLTATSRPATSGTLSKRPIVCSRLVLPSNVRYCLGLPAPIRAPTPAAGTATQQRGDRDEWLMHNQPRPPRHARASTILRLV